MMKEFVNGLNYEELEKLEMLVADAKRIKNRKFATELMDEVVNAFDKAKTELDKRFGDSDYIILEINGNDFYLDETIYLEIRLEDRDNEYDSEILYSESF